MTDSELKLLGDRLIELRLAKGCSAALVAEQVLGYSKGSHVGVTRLERGLLAQPKSAHLSQLATFYGVEPEFLFVSKASGDSLVPEVPSVRKIKYQATSRSTARLPQDLHGRVRFVREAAGLDASSFAAALTEHGALIISADVVAWESAEREPNPIQLRALGRFADCAENWFIGGGPLQSVAVVSARSAAWGTSGQSASL